MTKTRFNTVEERQALKEKKEGLVVPSEQTQYIEARRTFKGAVKTANLNLIMDLKPKNFCKPIRRKKGKWRRRSKM